METGTDAGQSLAWLRIRSRPHRLLCCYGLQPIDDETGWRATQALPCLARLGNCRCLHRLLGRCGAQGRMDCVLLLRCGVGVAEGMRG